LGLSLHGYINVLIKKMENFIKVGKAVSRREDFFTEESPEELFEEEDWSGNT